jgi:predicted enzyme related to lactoylglutathione lyase
MQLDTARIFVDDIAAAKAFYSSALALPMKIDGERHGFCVFSTGGVELVVELVPQDAPDDDRELIGRFTGLSFTVQDLQAKYAELLAKGVVFSGAPKLQAWGGTLATFADSSGNQLQLVQGPAA